MTRKEKMEEIADILEMEAEELQDDMALDALETWDSVAVLSFIAFMHEKFDKYFHAKDIQKIKTVGELADMMEK